MSDINFVDLDIQTLYKEAVDTLQNELGETLYEGDERLIFFQNLFGIQVAQIATINDCAKQNLLRYARGEKLDAIGQDFYYTERLQAQKATCMCKVTLSAEQKEDITIPKGTRITSFYEMYFESESDIIIEAGELEASGKFVSQEAGRKYSGLAEGSINKMVDVIPYVQSIVNITETLGGTDTESDEDYRERCRLSKNALSTAGPYDSYRFLAISANAAVEDAKPVMSEPGTVKIILLLEDGAQADEEIINDVKEACSDKTKRPLTDKVEVVSAETVPYNIELTYYLDKNHSTDETKYRKAIEGENYDNRTGAIRNYIKWQQNTLGLPISPDELRYKIQDAATYTTIEGNKYTAVRRVVITEPVYTEIEAEKIGKVGTINVAYGGLE